MSKEEYMIEREKLLAKAEEMLNSNSLAEAESIKADIEQLDAKFAEIAEARANAEAMENKTVTEIPEIINENNETMEDSKMEKLYNAASEEYRSAWLKNMCVNGKGEYLLGRPSAPEMEAYATTTANTGSVVPTATLNRIVELVESMSPIYADATASGMVSGFGVPRHSAIAAGDATTTDEGVANSDEQDTFNLLSLDGVEIKKHIKITRKMSFQSIDAFEDWVVTHLADRIANAKEVRILSQLSSTTYGIASANVLTGQTYSDATLRTIFSMIKGNGEIVVYANNKTIWQELYGIQDANDHPIFLPSSMEAGNAGRIYGAPVKKDENIPDDVIYVGIPKQIIANDFDKLAIAQDMDATSFVTTIGAYSLFDAGLENPLSFVKASF